MPWVILAVALIVGLVLVARWWVSAEPATLWRVLRRAGAVLGAVLLVWVVMSGRWSLLWAVVLPAIPWLIRLRALNTLRRNAAGPRAGQTSGIETRFLRMTLDHDSGEMDGEVREGAFAGRQLSQLVLGELIALWRTCAAEDEQSRAVLETYLDRAHPEWRAVAGIAGAGEGGQQSGSGGDPRAGAGAGMSVEEACEVLGVAPRASPEEVERAYRRAMKAAHPDHGGSDWLAAKVNQARDALIGRKG